MGRILCYALLGYWLRRVHTAYSGCGLLPTEKVSAGFVDSKENKWVGSWQSWSKEGTVKARKLAYYGHTMRKQGSCLEKEIMQGTMSGARGRGKPRTAWVDNIKTWTGLPVEESVRMTEGRYKVTSMVWPTVGSRTAEEQNIANRCRILRSLCAYMCWAHACAAQKRSSLSSANCMRANSTGSKTD